jgi:hypothetical protein
MSEHGAQTEGFDREGAEDLAALSEELKKRLEGWWRSREP